MQEVMKKRLSFGEYLDIFKGTFGYTLCGAKMFKPTVSVPSLDNIFNKRILLNIPQDGFEIDYCLDSGYTLVCPFDTASDIIGSFIKNTDNIITVIPNHTKDDLKIVNIESVKNTA